MNAASLDVEHLRNVDRRHLWHPYSPARVMEKRDFPVIARASGVWLEGTDGSRWLDGISSWWCVNLGHCHPRITAAIRDQAGRLQHSILGGMSHPGAIRLAEELCAAAPAGLTRAYFCGDGASATEAAMRLAIECQYHRGHPEKHRIVSLAGGYHGDTLGTVAAGYIEGFHAALRPALHPGPRADAPDCFECEHRDHCGLECFASMERLLRSRSGEVAAVIVEPLCQGAAGMRIYPDGYMRKLRTLCDETGVMLIADEIAVGFGRSGEMFACRRAGVAPDLMCLGKGMTGGTLPMSAVLCNETIYDTFRGPPDAPLAFSHGHTFGGNPLAAAAALSALELYRDEKLWTRVAVLSEQMRAGFERLNGMPAVDRTAVSGMMSSLRVRGGAGEAGRISARAQAEGLMIRPLGDILYLWPPLTTREEELAMMFERFENALAG